jgi:hypothetical protein
MEWILFLKWTFRFVHVNGYAESNKAAVSDS